MRRKIYLIIVFLTISLTVMPIQGLQGSSQNISSYGVISYSSGMKWLRTNGKWIVDEDENIVILRGANFMGYEFGAWGTHTEEDYARMASWGFNVVRLPIAWHYIEPEPSVYNSSYFEKYVDRDIVWAKKYGIYIILDMHQWYWSQHFTFFGGRGNGMPVWMVSGYPDSAEGLAQAVTDFWLGKGPNGTEASASNRPMQERFFEVWKYVASRYKNESTIAGYDLFNEPLNGYVWYKDLDSIVIPQFYERLIDAIRTVDSDHILLWQTRYGDPINPTKSPSRSNIAYSAHIYGPEPYDFNATRIESKILKAMERSVGVQPIIVSEYASDANKAHHEEWTKDALTLFDEYQLSALWWSYWKSDTYGRALLYANGTERIAFLKHVDRPFVIQSSIVASWYLELASTDTSKEFRVVTTTGNGIFKMEIYIPDRHYGLGFSLRANVSHFYYFRADTEILLVLLQLTGGSATINITSS